MLTKDHTYGSDQNGLILGFRFTRDKAAETVTSEEAVELLSSQDVKASQAFVWLHFSLSNTASKTWMKRHLDLPEAFFQSLHSENRSTRLEQDDDALLSEQTGRSLFVLTVVTVLALPVNMVSGLFGMNVGGIPLADNSYGFLVIIVILLALTAILAYLALDSTVIKRN